MPVPTFTLPDGRTVRLGRIRPVAAFDYGPFRIRKYADGRTKATPRLSAYYDAGADAQGPPDATNWLSKAGNSVKRMYKNDVLGICVIASAYHRVGVLTGNESGMAVEGTDREAEAAYHLICGPGDNGCVITDVLDATKKDGLKFNGVVHKIDDYVSVDHTNQQLVKVAIDLFGCGPIGIDMPNAWLPGRGDGGDGSVWDVSSGGNSGEGHDVNVCDYTPKGVVIETWGGTRIITWAAFTSRKWITEFEVVLAKDWYAKDDLAPNGISVDKLRNDLALLASGQIPPIDPPTPPLLDYYF